MKKIAIIILVAAMVLSAFALTGCGKAETVKLGLGVYSYYTNAKDADGETKGTTEVDSTAAAVLVNDKGVIVKCLFDVAQNKGAYSSDGKYIPSDSYPTKYEKGPAYGMAGKVDKNGDDKMLEWNEQADAFIALVEGKTLEQVKALCADDDYGTEEVQTAGCTIHVVDFVKAIEKAVANATVEVKATDKLGLGVTSTQSYSSKDATEDAAGVNQVDTHYAAVTTADGNVTGIIVDSTQAKFAFDITGKATLDIGTAIPTKVELGDNYNMAKYGANQDLNGDGKVLEWYAQADAFEVWCVGKTATEITAGAVASGDKAGYGVDDLQTAGCTIHVTDLVSAAAKAAK